MLQQQVDDVKRLWANKRQLAHQGLNLAMVVLTALMIWKGLMMFTESESPVVVVLSGSMEPAFQRGDILYLDNRVRFYMFLLFCHLVILFCFFSCFFLFS